LPYLSLSAIASSLSDFSTDWIQLAAGSFTEIAARQGGWLTLEIPYSMPAGLEAVKIALFSKATAVCIVPFSRRKDLVPKTGGNAS
jgi:hypothetical protein